MTVYVSNVLALARQVSRHRRRVYRIGTYLDRGITTKVILLVHDIEKYLFLPWLWKYYGEKDKKTLKQAKKVYTRLNKVGRAIKRVATCLFNQADVAESTIVEHIADVVDRHMDPVANEEFGRDMKTQPLSKFLPDRDVEIAEWLCINYTDICGPLAISDRRKENRH